MSSPLWTERYAPTLEELPQSHLRDYLRQVQGRPVNLLLYGPPGGGKTAAVRAAVRATYDEPANVLLELNMADFFDRTKREIVEDTRFQQFIDNPRLSKREMIQRVFRESTAHAPVSGEFRIVLLDNAESVREDFQHALRRLIERHHQNAQFILTTRQLGRVIPALRSRCLPVPVPRPDDQFVIDRLETVLTGEGIPFERPAVTLLAEEANGNLRRAILAAQATTIVNARTGRDTLTEASVFETLSTVGDAASVEELLAHADAGEFDEARDVLDELLLEVGLDGREILDRILATGRTRYDEGRAAALTERIADIDMYLATGGRDRVQLSKLIADLPELGA